MEKNKSDKDRWHEFRADHLIAIFTGLLFVANILLWLTTWKLVTSAKETARLDQRAWVVIDPLPPPKSKSVLRSVLSLNTAIPERLQLFRQ